MFHSQHYDRYGVLKLPPLFWGILILQARSWLLLVIAGASRNQGDALLTLFYPETSRFYAGLIAGLPAVVAFLLSGRRQHYPRLWQGWYWALIVAQLVLLIWQAIDVYIIPDGISALLVVLDGVALTWLLTHKRLRAAFRPMTKA